MKKTSPNMVTYSSEENGICQFSRASRPQNTNINNECKHWEK